MAHESIVSDASSTLWKSDALVAAALYLPRCRLTVRAVDKLTVA